MFPTHALVCESIPEPGFHWKKSLISNFLSRIVKLPVSLEEQVICFSDKFYSKTHLDREKTVDAARKSLSKYGEEGLTRFNRWCELFL